MLPEVAKQKGHEPYRGKCRFIAAKLQRTIDYLHKLDPRWTAEDRPPPPGVYLGRPTCLPTLAAIADDFGKSARRPPPVPYKN